MSGDHGRKGCAGRHETLRRGRRGPPRTHQRSRRLSTYESLYRARMFFRSSPSSLSHRNTTCTGRCISRAGLRAVGGLRQMGVCRTGLRPGRSWPARKTFSNAYSGPSPGIWAKPSPSPETAIRRTMSRTPPTIQGLQKLEPGARFRGLPAQSFSISWPPRRMRVTV